MSFEPKDDKMTDDDEMRFHHVMSPRWRHTAVQAANSRLRSLTEMDSHQSKQKKQVYPALSLSPGTAQVMHLKPKNGLTQQF